MTGLAKSHHVHRAVNGGWSVIRKGSDRATRVFATQAEAVSWAREQSIKDRSDLVIHRRDGTVAQKKSYGSFGRSRDE